MWLDVDLFGSGRIDRVWSAREKSLKILRQHDRKLLNERHRTDSGIDTFTLPTMGTTDPEWQLAMPRITTCNRIHYKFISLIITSDCRVNNVKI